MAGPLRRAFKKDKEPDFQVKNYQSYLVRIFTKPDDEIAVKFEDPVNTEQLLFYY